MTITPARQQYTSFGLTITSTVPLSGPTPSTDALPSDADICITQASLPLDADRLQRESTLVHEGADRGMVAYRTSDSLYWFCRGVGTLRVRDGRSIEVAPVPTACDGAVERLVVGPGIQSALVQRGQFVLHASAVAIDDTLVAIAGPSGRGKSTVAAACYASGHAIHADDTVAVKPAADGEMVVPPGIPRLRVARPVVDALSLTASGSTEGVEKVALDISDRFSEASLELDRVYLLTDDDQFGISTLSNREAVFKLLRASYALYGKSDTERAGEHLEVCANLVRSVGVHRLCRPRSLECVGDLVQRLEADVQS